MESLYVVDGAAVKVWEMATYLAPVMGAVMRIMVLEWQFAAASTHTFPPLIYSTLPSVSPVAAELTQGSRLAPLKSPLMTGMILCVATAADVAVTVSVTVSTMVV